MSLLLLQQFHTYFVLLLKDELIWPMPAPKVDFMFPAACRKHCFNTSKEHFKYPGNRFYVLQLRTNPMILCVTIMNPYQQHLGMQTTPNVNLLVQTPVQMLQPYLTVYSMRSFEVILLDCPERPLPPQFILAYARTVRLLMMVRMPIVAIFLTISVYYLFSSLHLMMI